MNTITWPVLGGVALQVLVNACAAAQAAWPPAFASVRGNAVMNAPFTVGAHHTSPTTRCCVVLDASTLPFPIGTVLNRITLRRDGAYPQGYASASGQLTVRLGRASAAPGDLNDVRYVRLFEGEPKAVYVSSPQSPYILPAAAPPTGSGPAPFNIAVPFQNSYAWMGGPLAIEIAWTPLAGSSAFRIDAVALPRRNGVSRTIASGCTGSNGFEPTHFVLPETTNPGAILQTQLEGARSPTHPTELLALHVLGTAPGSPMPLSMIGGVPGCSLRVDPLLSQLFVVSNPSRMFARATSSASLPAHAWLVGFVLHSQWLCFDTAFATSVPLTASDVQAITLGPVVLPEAPRVVRTWWRYGSASQGQESFRMVPDDYGPVLLFN
jgi:hypothetical protein